MQECDMPPPGEVGADQVAQRPQAEAAVLRPGLTPGDPSCIHPKCLQGLSAMNLPTEPAPPARAAGLLHVLGAS